MEAVIRWWLEFLGWLGREHMALSGLTALATVAGVIVAGVYAALTWRLARQATRQANITQRMFDATYRPYVEAVFVESNFYRDPTSYRLDIELKHHGPVPAWLRRWSLTVIQDGHPPYQRESDEGWTRPLYPQAERMLDITRQPVGTAATGPVRPSR